MFLRLRIHEVVRDHVAQGGLPDPLMPRHKLAEILELLQQHVVSASRDCRHPLQSSPRSKTEHQR
jgi:hypothetical protein